jgi:energy-coupling factor transport system ATP-binding protein
MVESTQKKNDNVIVKNFSCSYPYGDINKKALSNLNFTLAKGQIIGLMGRSGSGKTTLLYSLLGVIPSVLKCDLSGRIVTFGLDTQKEDLSKIASKVQLVSQTPGSTFFTGSVFDEIIFGLENRGLNAEQIDSLIDEVVPYTGVKHLLHRSPHLLSSGEQQRVALTSALLFKPQLLLLDEPTAFLDTKATHELKKILKKLIRSKKISVMVAEHDIDFLSTTADHFIVLDNGEKVLDGPTRVVVEDEKFVKLFTKPSKQKIQDLAYKLAIHKR